MQNKKLLRFLIRNMKVYLNTKLLMKGSFTYFQIIKFYSKLRVELNEKLIVFAEKRSISELLSIVTKFLLEERFLIQEVRKGKVRV